MKLVDLFLIHQVPRRDPGSRVTPGDVHCRTKIESRSLRRRRVVGRTPDPLYELQ